MKKGIYQIYKQKWPNIDDQYTPECYIRDCEASTYRALFEVHRELQIALFRRAASKITLFIEIKEEDDETI